VAGAKHYVEKMLLRIPDARLHSPVRQVHRVPPGQGSAGVWVRTDAGTERFDELVLACHSDQSADASPGEREVLGAVRYQRKRAVLHTDTTLLPRRRSAWAAWNCERAVGAGREDASVCLHYLIDRLQPLPFSTPVVVSLNPARMPRADTVHGEYDYAHPDGSVRRLMALARPLIGIGQVRHTRLRPLLHRFAYPTCFLLLPLRSLRVEPSRAVNRNRRGSCSIAISSPRISSSNTSFPEDCCPARASSARPQRVPGWRSSTNSSSGLTTPRRCVAGANASRCRTPACAGSDSTTASCASGSSILPAARPHSAGDTRVMQFTLTRPRGARR
jgi:hypothetical protein